MGSRKAGDRLYVHDLLTITTPGVNVSNVQGSNPPGKAMRALALAYKHRQADVPFPTEEMRALLNNDAHRA